MGERQREEETKSEREGYTEKGRDTEIEGERGETERSRET